MDVAFDQLLALLPYELRRAVSRCPAYQRPLVEELRLRMDRPPTLVYNQREHLISGWSERAMTGEELATVVEIATQSSAHTALHQMRQGFITLHGGHRLGLTGTVTMGAEGVQSVRHLSSIAIRLAHDVSTAAQGVAPHIWSENKLQSTLIIAPPGVGKTTLLRDLIRRISDGIDLPPHRVGLADERGEVAALYQGVPQLNVGHHTDILDGCPKAEGLLMLLRGMNPQVLATDEITHPSDVEALRQVVGCGVSLLCTAHGGSVADLYKRSIYRTLMADRCFERVVVLGWNQGMRQCQVISAKDVAPCSIS